MEPIDSSPPDGEDEDSDPDDSPYSSSDDPPASPDFRGSCQGSLQEAWDYLRASIGSSSDRGASSSIKRQQATLIGWARQTGRIIHDQEVSALPVVSDSTSEHRVRFRASDERAVKTTWPGFYGQVPVGDDGRLQREPATPAQYLVRMMIQNEVFRGSSEMIELAGIHIPDGPSFVIGEPPGQPGFVITQRWYPAAEADRLPSPRQVETFLRAFGFLPVGGSYFGWVRSEDGIVIVDARTDNFILTSQGSDPH